jgi:sulfite exporter TauE/SafE
MSSNIITKQAYIFDMIHVLLISLTMGFISSWHCAGMCGPLVLSMPGISKTNNHPIIDTLLYHAGRIMIYATGGLIAGVIGRNFQIASSQQQISLWLGVIILFYVLTPKKFSARLTEWTHTSTFFDYVRLQITSLWHRPNRSTRFFLGALNGVLPCGMVYLALASALTTGSIGTSILFMIGFGVGTLPMLVAIAYIGKMLHYKVRLGMQRAVPFFLVTMACLLMLRGLGLGIPYLSPTMKSAGTHKPACCSHPVE